MSEKCNICGSTNLFPDPAGYYNHAPDMLCLDHPEHMEPGFNDRLLTREFLAERLIEVSEALMKLHQLYYHAREERVGPEPAPFFAQEWVNKAWQGSHEALANLTTQNQGRVGQQYDVLHRARRILQ